MYVSQEISVISPNNPPSFLCSVSSLLHLSPPIFRPPRSTRVVPRGVRVLEGTATRPSATLRSCDATNTSRTLGAQVQVRTRVYSRLYGAWGDVGWNTDDTAEWTVPRARRRTWRRWEVKTTRDRSLNEITTTTLRNQNQNIAVRAR